MAASPTTDRRTDLDWLRVLLFGGLIVYHLGLMYAAWSPFAVKSGYRAEWVEVALMSTHPWRMPLLFLISGVATKFALDKLGGASKLALSRTIQLLPPLLFGIVLIVPLQGYLPLIDSYGYQKSYPAYLVELFSSDHQVVWGGKRFVMPHYAHLWFVAYLWTYAMGLALVLRFAPRAVAWAQARLEALMAGPGLLLWPLVLLLALRFTLFPIFSVTLELTNDWYTHAVSASMFLFGFLVARSARVWDQVVALRWFALVLGAAAYAGYGAMAWGQGSPEQVEQTHPLMHLLYPVMSWGGIVAVLGFARGVLRWNNRTLAYLNGAMFTYYIVHQPALFLLMRQVKTWGLHPGVEFATVLGGTAVVCAVAYELARGLGLAGAFLGAPRGRPAPAWAKALRNGSRRLVGERPQPVEGRV
ncbi:MAG: hypothetical protein B7Y99_02255 [Caulobacterales bacterium 32-69-10]|nr:MAG: hypothetical protein B7Y99_02255 [Caulobacterales bacterium 32-69-10]